jgi:hypothetical protein
MRLRLYFTVGVVSLIITAASGIVPFLLPRSKVVTWPNWGRAFASTWLPGWLTKGEIQVANSSVAGDRTRQLWKISEHNNIGVSRHLVTFPRDSDPKLTDPFSFEFSLLWTDLRQKISQTQKVVKVQILQHAAGFPLPFIAEREIRAPLWDVPQPYRREPKALANTPPVDQGELERLVEQLGFPPLVITPSTNRVFTYPNAYTRITGLVNWPAFFISFAINCVWCLGLLQLVMWIRRWRSARAVARSLCASCRYPVAGLASCPECGTANPRAV